ncbi:flavin reductase family protein [Actinosynnema pretiosum]|uniref:Flavin reductase n=1 Tax=Actinosynnema pretiosum TaxID=42197 RepID=A0A290Z8N1_9PSEU|nr:flavin reductase family protein [Actinosynnema pretiosum]ATE55356.1 flavin reductase [Actinosynnema pretiosum]
MTGAVVGATALREVMSRFATGVTVVTVGGEHPHGMTANAFTSVSLDPPLVLCCVARSATMHEALPEAGRFAVSIMDADQGAVARHFADKRRPTGEREFAGLDWAPGPLSGAPLLTGSLAWLECELAHRHDGGDHTIYVGRVLDCGVGGGERALLFYGSTFHHL